MFQLRRRHANIQSDLLLYQNYDSKNSVTPNWLSSVEPPCPPAESATIIYLIVVPTPILHRLNDSITMIFRRICETFVMCFDSQNVGLLLNAVHFLHLLFNRTQSLLRYVL